MLHNTPSNWFGTAVVAVVIVCVVPLTAWSQEQQGFAKMGGYAGGTFVPGFTLDGETFDGIGRWLSHWRCNGQVRTGRTRANSRAD
jgi:hypothetical protein